MLDEIISAFIKLAIKVIRVLRILWSEIKGWFKERIAQIRANAANLAFSIKNHLANGEHEVIQGIFNKDTGAFYNAQAQDVQAPEIDEETESRHRNNKLVLFD